jgi:hypothetical protein
MELTYWLDPTDPGKADQLDRAAERMPEHAEKLGITDAQVASLKADAAAFRFVETVAAEAQVAATSWTAERNLLRDGGKGSGVYPPLYLSNLTPPPMVEPGIIPRVVALMTQAKASPNYTEAIGKDLDIVGTRRVIDPTTWQPQLKLQLDAGHVKVTWFKGDADALELWVSRGPSADFALLDVTTKPRYIDPTPHPASPAKWTYKAIYRLRDERVGSWSGVVSILVGG